MFSSSKWCVFFLILLLASLTHWLKLVVLSHYYLHMMKSCYNPLVCHLRQKYMLKVAWFDKGTFNNAICFTLFNTTTMCSQKKHPHESLYFRNACLLFCVWKHLKTTTVLWHSSTERIGQALPHTLFNKINL